MSFLTARSSFFYGHTITVDNFAIDFDEGGPELLASLRRGSYTPTEFAQEIADQMTASGGQEYTVTFNRTTRKITISAPGTFKLRTNTGSRSGSAMWVLAGFSIVADHSGTNTYTGENASGFEYRPQAVLKDYISPTHFKVKQFARVNETVTGNVQVAEFGTTSRIEFNIWLVTDRTGVGSNVEDQVDAIANTLDLFDYLITKAKFEFMPDRSAPSTYYRCILERTNSSQNGTGYQLEEMSAKDFYQSGRMQLRVLPD